jgi:putative Holliday junction resolvase
MRILGIDYGTKRLGLAISDDKETMALPYLVIETEKAEQQISQIRHIVESERIGKIVIGLPYKHDDTIGRRAENVLSFAEELKKNLSIPIETYDERLTTVQSQELLRDVKSSREKKRRNINAVAAQLILQGYLDEKVKL